MIILGDKTYQVEQKRLRNWIYLEEIKVSLGEAIERKDKEKIVDSLCHYVSIAFDVDKDEVSKFPWKEVAEAFNDSYLINMIDLDHISFLKAKNILGKKEPWDYTGRTWWSWVFSLAKEFGWDIEYISSLDVLSAFSLMQEIMLNGQFEKEWEWMLSEYSLKYNKTTKKSEPNPLPRPDWMKVYDVPPVKVEQIKVSQHMMPVGNVIGHKDIKP